MHRHDFSKVLTYFDMLGQSIGAEFFLAGGAVRDRILGLPVKDFDLIARNLTVDELLVGLQGLGRAELLGERFKVIAFQPEAFGGRFEIALPRTEVKTGPGTNGFTPVLDPELSVEDDLARRDFTINAMAVNVHTRELIDPLGAQKDLEQGIIRALHWDSFTDDPVRILRALRFVAKLGFSLERDTSLQIRNAAHLLADRKEVPAERIQDELITWLKLPDADVPFRHANALGLLPHFLPELRAAHGCTQNSYHSFDVFEHTMRVLKGTESHDWEVKMAALLHDIGKPPTRWVGTDGVAHFYFNNGSGTTKGVQEYAPGGEPEIPGAHEEVGAEIARDILTRLKFSNDQIERISGMVREHMFGESVRMRRPAARRFLKRLNELPGELEDNVTAMFAIRRADTLGGKAYNDETAKTLDESMATNERFERIVRDELAQKNAMSVKDLAIGGTELMSLGYEGQAIGVAQRRLLELVLDDPRRNTREALVALATGPIPTVSATVELAGLSKPVSDEQVSVWKNEGGA